MHHLVVRGFSLSGGEDLPDFFTHGIQCDDVTDLAIDCADVSPNPNAPGAHPLLLERTTSLETLSTGTEYSTGTE